MVTKTRSNDEIVGLEEMNEFRSDVASLKKEVVELKGLRSEVKEIKGLLLELCKQKGNEGQENPVGDAAAKEKSTGEAGPSRSVQVTTPSLGVQFSIEPNTMSLSAPMGQEARPQGGVSSVQTDLGQVTTVLSKPPPFIPFAPFPNQRVPFLNSAPFQTQTTVGGRVPNSNFQTQGTATSSGTGQQGVHILDHSRPGGMVYQGENQHYAEAVIKGPRLEIPLFTGEDPIDWLKQCEKFYEITGTPYDQWVNLAIAHLQGRAMKWFRGVGIPWQLIPWPQWCHMVSTRFSAANEHEAVELFQNVKQYGSTVEQYIDKFEEYVDLVRRDHPYLQEQYLNSCFIGGLRGDIKHDVCGQKPQGLLESYWYAKNYEKAANARKVALNFSRNRNQNTNFNNPGRNANNRPQRGDGEKKEDRKCWFCKEPWFPRHQCKVKQAINALLVENEPCTEEEEDESKEKEQEELATDQIEAPKQEGAHEELMSVSFSAASGTTRPDTFSVLIMINGKQAVGLIDSGSTGTFMTHEFAVKCKCPIATSTIKKVIVAGGGELKSNLVVPEVAYKIQGVKFVNAFSLITLKGYDVILGADWIFRHSPITLDLKQRELSITKEGKLVEFQDFTKPGKHFLIDGHKMEKLIKKGAVGCVLQVNAMTEEERKEEAAVPADVQEVLSQFPGVMKEPKGLPPRRACDHVINLKPGSEPPNQRPYRVPHYQKEAMENIISDLIQSKEIRFSDSPYSCPAVMVRKRDGSWRMCVDYRQLNAQTVKNKFPMPIIEDLLDELHGARIFSKLDLRSGYHQIRMAEEDIPKTAFKTHMGHYEYQVMPFGLTNAPATFQSLMNQVLAPFLRKFVLVFFDDILIYSKTREEHIKHINAVLQVMEKNQLVVRLKKCAFGLSSVAYLGHVISSDGVATDPSKISDIMNRKEPKNVTEVREFLGMTGYYRRFIKGYGLICRPLHDMLKKGGFNWGLAQSEAFTELKGKLCTSPVLALPNFEQPFVIEADACEVGIGAVLMQAGRPIAYYSKALGPKAAAQSIYEKEAMAILEALKRWRHYVLGGELVIKTDQQSLKYMMNQRLVEGIQHKLLLKLMEYNYTIEYKAGRENLVADALSRSPKNKEEVTELCAAIAVVVPEWILDIKRSYEEDVQAHKLLSLIGTAGDPEGEYKFEAGIMKYKGRIYVGETGEIRGQLIQAFHSSTFGGHSGIRATYQRIKKLFYWPGLKKGVENHIRNCPVCHVTKSEHVHIPGLLNPLEVPDMAWTHISMDFVEGLPKSKGKDVILVVEDRLTKYAHFIALSHPYTVEEVVQVFMDNIHKLHGMPIAIVTDRDRVFTSTFFQEVFKSQKVQLRFSTAYHPQTDGQTERVNQCLESYLRCMTFQEPQNWCSWIALAEWWYNTTYHTAIQMTPFKALYGYSPPQISEFSVPCDVSQEARVTLEEKEAIVQKLKASMEDAQRRMKYYADRNRTERKLEVGDMVYLKLQPYRQNAFGIRGSLKLRGKYYGPFKVLEKVGAVAYRLQLPEEAALHPVFHVSQLKKHLGTHAVPMPNLPAVGPDGQIKTEPVAVLQRRMIPRNNVAVTQWLILWSNLTPAEATWEDASYIQKVFPNFQP